MLISSLFAICIVCVGGIAWHDAKQSSTCGGLKVHHSEKALPPDRPAIWWSCWEALQTNGSRMQSIFRLMSSSCSHFVYRRFIGIRIFLDIFRIIVCTFYSKKFDFCCVNKALTKIDTYLITSITIVFAEKSWRSCLYF